MKVLIISLAGIGDTLFTTPLISELRANFPNATIDALVLWGGAKDVLLGNPNLNEIFQKNLIKENKVSSLRFLRTLRKRRYDVSFNTHPQSRVHYRIVARLINAGLRVSHDYDNATPFDRLLVNRVLKQDYGKHAIENNLGFLELIGARLLQPRHDYEVFLTAADRQWAGDFVARQNWSGRKLLGIHVGSGGTKNLSLRRWPLEHYLGLFEKLRRNHPEAAVLLFGGPEEQGDHELILAQTSRDQVWAAETGNLRQVAALLKRCDAFLSVDTTLMHLATAMKVPRQIVIETPTWNKPIEPYNNPFVLVKNPAVGGRNLEYYRYDGRGIRGTKEELLRCMASVTVEAVYQEVEKALAGNPGSRD
jgi:heptosyltransferase-2